MSPAQEEAERRWPRDDDIPPSEFTPSLYVEVGQRLGFTEGAWWQAQHDGIWHKRWQQLMREYEALDAKLERVRAVIDDPGGPDSWSHTFQGQHAVLAADLRAAMEDPS